MKTKKEIIALLRVWESTLHQMDKEHRKLIELVGTDGTLDSAICTLIDEYTNMTCHAVGDNTEALNWYRYDNDMGKRKMMASPSGDDDEPMRPVKNISDLAQLIVDAQIPK